MPRFIRENSMKKIIIEDIDLYNVRQEGGRLILTPKFPKSMTNIKILKCIITEKETNSVISYNKTSYRGILINIWKSMYLQDILDNTTFNIKESVENGAKGYHYQKDLNFSFQSKGADGTWKEIIKMVGLNQYQMDISLQLPDGKKIHYKLV